MGNNFEKESLKPTYPITQVVALIGPGENGIRRLRNHLLSAFCLNSFVYKVH